MNKVNEPQRVKLGPKHSRIAKTSTVQGSDGSDGYVTFAVGNQYKILEAIGTGAYGVVCSAIDTKTKQHVAIKKIVNPFEVLTTAKRTLRELKLLLHFKHDNVVGIRNIIQSKQKNPADVYLVMDLMESDLHHIIRSEQSLSPEHVCYFLYQLLRGLKYIHSASVIHRDLKPSNLLVNENCELKIGDFGMARGVSSTPEDHKMFMTEYVATRWYRAPELMLSIGEYSQAIDMWSVGCIFAEMMGRKQIFPGRHYVHQLQLVISVLGSPTNDLVKSIRSDRVRTYVRSLPHKEPVKLKTLYPTASAQMLELLQSFLQFNPANRPTAEQALTHSFLAGYHDVDDEPLCSHPFDFRFESTVTKSDVCGQVSTVIADYQDRKTRLSKQLIPVENNADGAKLSSITSEDSSERTRIPSVTLSSNGKDGMSVFKKPTVPCLNHKLSSYKTNEQLLPVKSLNIDVDMKSASSVSSMDLNITDLARSQDLQISMSKSIQPTMSKDGFAKKVASTILVKPTPSNQSIITVQVVDDGVVDLTGDDNKNAKEENKKLASKSKKDSEKVPPKKKTTISEDTKMKIRDSIFANMFAKQKGLGKPLEKVKKSVTAAERQREREEKRKKRLERAAQKEKKKEEEERKKNPLSEADRSLLNRWMKMQEKKSQDLASTHSEVIRSKSSNIQTEGKPVTKNEIVRRLSFPQSAHCNNAQNINSQDMILESTKPSNKTGSNHIITVMFTEDSNSSSSNVTKDTSQFTVTESATTCKVSTLFDSSKKTNLNHLKASASSNCTSFSTISYPLQQTNCAVAYIQAKPFSSVKHSLDDHHLMPQTINASNSSMKNNKENNFIASVGAMYFPDDPHLDSSANEDVAPTRPNLLFSVDGESKALVGNHLLTPGKALQQNSSLSTPHGRNLAALSPDTIDCVLNDEFQNHSDFKEQEITKSLSSSRPASYPSLTSADLDVLNSYDDPYQVSDSCTYRSNSFTHGCVHRKSAPDSHDSAISSNTTSSHQTVTFSQEDLRLDKKLNTASSFEFSPASFLRSIDEHISYPSSSVCTNTQSDQNNGGLFLPNLDISVLSQPHASSVMMSDALPSAGAASAVGYGLGVDIADIIPSSAGDVANSGMECAADQTDSSLLADWLDLSCLCPQDMEALQKELELGSPMCIDGS